MLGLLHESTIRLAQRLVKILLLAAATGHQADVRTPPQRPVCRWSPGRALVGRAAR